MLQLHVSAVLVSEQAVSSRAGLFGIIVVAEVRTWNGKGIRLVEEALPSGKCSVKQTFHKIFTASPSGLPACWYSNDECIRADVSLERL